MDTIEDLREYDVPYHTRVCIDLNIRISHWYNISFKGESIDTIAMVEEMTERPEFNILAFDIETSKLPLKFPDSAMDNIIMISMCMDSQAFLITNRDVR